MVNIHDIKNKTNAVEEYPTQRSSKLKKRSACLIDLEKVSFFLKAFI